MIVTKFRQYKLNIVRFEQRLKNELEKKKVGKHISKEEKLRLEMIEKMSKSVDDFL